MFAKSFLVTELGAYLQQATEAGVIDSSGSITLNLLKSKKKLDAYRLEAPHHYVLPLVSAAVLSGATCIDFRGDFENLEVRFDGDSFSAEDLAQALVAPSGRGAELGLFFRSLLTLEPQQVQLVSGHQSELQIMTLADGKPKLSSRATTYGPSFTSVQVQGAKRKGTSSSLHSFLADRCSYTPAVAVEGKRVHIPSLVDSCAAVRLEAPHRGSPATSLRSWVTIKYPNEHISGQVWMADAETSRLVFVMNGVSYPRPVEFRAFQGLRGVISCPRLKLDISRSGVIRDEAYQETLDSIEEQFKSRVFPSLMKAYKTMMPVDRELAKKHLVIYATSCDQETRERIRARVSG